MSDKGSVEKDSTLKNHSRLLTLIEIMQKHSDEEHPITLKEIVDYFPLEVNEATIRADLTELSTSEVYRICFDYKIGTKTKYWYDGVGLQLHELRLLLDAVVAARFIPPKETLRLVDQLKRFSGNHITEEMGNQIYIADEPGVAIQNIGQSVHLLHKAIQNSQVVKFQYGKYTTEKEFVLNRQGDYYEMKPYGLVWSQDFYYLIAQPKNQSTMKHFRVDRMRSITQTEELFAKEPHFDMNAYLKKLFHMYSGDDMAMEVEFDNHLINVIIDRFGPEADIRPLANGKFKLFSKVVYSDGLVRWLLTWGSDAKVLYPKKLVDRMKEETEKLYKLYD